VNVYNQDDKIKKRVLLIKIALALSGTAVTIINYTSNKWFPVICFVSFVTWCFLLFKTELFNVIFSECPGKRRLILTLITSIAIISSWWMTQGYFVTVIYAGILTPAVFFFLNYFLGILYQTTRAIIADMKKYEIVYLAIVGVIIITSIITVYTITSVFYEPLIDGKLTFYNTIFTSDSPAYFVQNVFLNISTVENDIRHPLFGLFAMPFSVYPFIISKLFSHIHGLYPALLQIIQVVLLQTSLVLLSRIMGIRGISAVAFWIMLSLSYPYLLFVFMPEQYIFSVFYLVLFLYLHFNKDTIHIKNGRKMFFIASTGTLLTSAILFPCALVNKGRKAVRELVDLGIAFLLAVYLCGQARVLFYAFSRIKALMRFAGGSVPFVNRLYQYLNFMALCFKNPDVIIHKNSSISYQLAPVASLNYMGILFFILIVFSFMVNRKNKLAQVCMVWVLYSFIILCVIGWGTPENGLVLYSLYFSWGFFILLFMGIEKTLERYSLLKYCVYAILAVFLIFNNIPAIYDVIRFGINYYPIN